MGLNAFLAELKDSRVLLSRPVTTQHILAILSHSDLSLA